MGADYRPDPLNHPRAQAILAYVRKHPEATLQEIAEAVGLQRKSTAKLHIDRFIKAGVLAVERGARRTFKVRTQANERASK